MNVWSPSESAELGMADTSSKSLVLGRSLLSVAASVLVTQSAFLICSLSVVAVVSGSSVTLSVMLVSDWLLSLGVAAVSA